MRTSLRNKVKDTIVFECKLPDRVSGLSRSHISTNKDSCFSNDDIVALSSIIYNGIVEFAVNQYKINYHELDLEQLRTIASRIKYDRSATQQTKLKYGFYGEVLLDLILRSHMQVNVLIARGYFYLPTAKAEPTGFDAFHIMERNGKLELWFGEAKFHINYKQAIDSVLNNIQKSLSDEYVQNNLISIISEENNITTQNSQLTDLLCAWKENPNVNLAVEMRLRNIRLIYPILIAYEQTDRFNYHNNIKSCIDHIDEQSKKLNITISATFDYCIRFIFLPVSEVKKVKETVIEWIENQEPLMP